MSQEVLELQSPPAKIRRAVVRCFHCGEPCPDDSFVLEARPFCCFGCQTVFSLLRENGLEQFYELHSAPGTRMRNATAAAKWTFLDDPAVAEQLLDYADKTRAKVTLHLPAIHCVACVWLVENLFKLHPGVGSSLVNFARREAAITFAPDQIKFSELAALLTSIGYEPQFTLGETEKTKPSPLSKKTWLQIGVAAFGFGNIMLIALPMYLGLDSANGPWFRALAGWLGLAMTLPVVTFSASDFWRAAWWSVRQRTLVLEVPIALGLAAIYTASVFEVLSHRGLGYCDSLCGLIFFLLCGRLFQKKTYDRLAFDRDYKGFFPLSVVRRNPRGDEESVAISRLQVGDKIILRNGELLPADARLVSGEASIDYSFVTGESEPVACEIGQHLYAGGRQAGGAIVAETIKPVAQSYLASLWNNEAFRKNRDSDLDSLTNRYSKRFTKIVIGVAAGAAVFWVFRDAEKSLKVFTSVLIVACPCALALAAPLTHGTAQRILARLKIFLKNALVIEGMAEVDTIVLDKTGTLTAADARGVEFIPATNSVSLAPGFNRVSGGENGFETVSTVAAVVKRTDESVFNATGGTVTGLKPSVNERLTRDEARWISSLARHSTHPNSVRVARALGGEALPVVKFQETPGCGIEGRVAGHQILLGSRAWVVAQASRLCAPNDSQTQTHRQDAWATTVTGSVFVAIDGQSRGAFAFENSLRPEVEKLIQQLGGRFELALLSGDNEREAARFKELFGGNAILRFNQSPADKLNFIRELQQRGKKVMMVGDGLNDAGALKQSDVGVAVVERVGVFSPACDVILDAAELPRLARVLEFSRRAARVVRAGFVISALYNLAGVSIAAAGLLAPVVCAVLMPVSTATVVVFSCGAATWAARRAGLLQPKIQFSSSETA